MQKRKSKLVVKTLVFILIVAIAVVQLSIIFTPKWLTGNAESAIAEHYYEIEDDSLEVLFLGSSQIAWNIDTVRLYEEYGIMSYGIGGSHNPPMVNYYWLLDAIDRHKTLKTVLVDTSLIFNNDDELCADYTKNLQYMKMISPSRSMNTIQGGTSSIRLISSPRNLIFTICSVTPRCANAGFLI